VTLADEPAPALLALLVCPVSRGRLLWDEANGRLLSPRAGLAYPVREGVPVLIAEAAEPLAPRDS
jgi:uncharacterized protein YbaR (Trm112 family)